MTFVSYARNFEDVMLWRVLRDVGSGFYIDVGAVHPDTDSVTRAFYDRGWTGINVQPASDLALRLEAARTRDVTLRLALWEAPGEAVLTAFGTSFAALTATGAGQDLPAVGSLVPVETLASICRRHAAPAIHFLRIDVPGAVHAVLAGGDFVTYRPWLILVGAVQPPSTIFSHAEWEPVLLLAGYRFVWFDGLTRFYLAQERHAAFSPCFATPPGVLDDFLRVADTAVAQRIGQAEAALSEARASIQATQEWAALAETRATGAYRQLVVAAAKASEQRMLADARAKEVGELWARVVSEQQRVSAEHDAVLQERDQVRIEQLRTRDAEDRVAQAEARLEAVRVSTSWRLTGPLRVATRLVLRPSRRPMAAALPPAEATPAVQDGARALEAPNASVLLDQAPLHITSPLPEAAAAPVMAPAAAALPVSFAGTAAARVQGPPRRTVHQFHPGSGMGDAITNAMLLTRTLLRRLGYDSEIFVQTLDPLLEHELHTMAALPRHDGYVLLVRHSMGFEALAEVMALPGPKVLIYHNITPPVFLAGNPFMQEYARLGRRQLEAMPRQVAAALADSEYNAIELRRLGFDPVQAMTLLFDLDTLQAPAMQRPHVAGKIFTILFVGRVTVSKCQDVLIRSYKRFRAGFEQPSRLVLVGRIDDGSGYVEALQGLIDEMGLQDHILLTGLVEDAELQGWYAVADLFVSLSLHEGFGVPLVEAMARGVPVLAWPSGAVAYTLGDAGGLLPDREPAAVAARMLELACDPLAMASLRQKQRPLLDRFRVDRQLPILVNALAMAGAAPPPDPAARQALQQNLRITVTGHAKGSYSLAAVNRELAVMLEQALPNRVRLAPVEGDAPAVLAGGDAAVLALAGRVPFCTGPEITVSNHYPVHVPPQPGDVALPLFYWEERLIPSATIQHLGRSFPGVLAPTRFVARALMESGLPLPVRVLGQALDLTEFRAVASRRGPRQGTVTFLHISSCFPRKGVDVLIEAFALAFRAGDAVRLVIKGFPNPHNDVAERLVALYAADPRAPEILLIDQDLDRAALLDLYVNADAMVLPTRGEGFNLPAAEAMAAGLPLIVTGAGGHRDFCDAATARLIRWHHAPATTHLSVAGSLWHEPEVDDLVDALRETAGACRDHGPVGEALRQRTLRASAAIAGRTATPAALAERIGEFGLDLLLAPPPRPPRIAWITSWDVRCGVAAYSRYLLEGFPGGATSGETVILADDRSDAVAAASAAGPRVLAAWRLGDPDLVTRLAPVILAEDPDVLVIQYQPGLFDFPTLAALLRSRAVQGRIVTVTLHNTRHLGVLEETSRADVLAALAMATAVIVHTVADLVFLEALGLEAPVMLMPQGAPPAMAAAGAAAAGGVNAAAPIIGSYGFFLPGKGLPQLIEAVAMLRARWPRLQLRLVNAEYDHPISAAEIAACRAAVAEAGMTNNVTFETAFLDPSASLRLLSGCSIVALPTQPSREASSASLRTALAAGRPLIVTPIALFDEAGEAVERFPGVDAASLAKGLERLLQDQDGQHRLIEAGATWLETHRWDVIGRRFQGLLTGLAAERHIRRR